jgi:hypothetical protein
MARSFSRPSALYQPGTYGPFVINGFNANNTDYLVLSLSIEGWPVAEAPLISGRLLWDSGDGAEFTFNSPRLDPRTGQMPTQASVRVEVPTRGTGRQPVGAATATLTLHQPLRTAITLAAVNA